MKPLRIAIVGATGRMGRALIRLLAAEPDLALAAAVTAANDPLLGRDAGAVAGGEAVGVALAADFDAPCEAVIEFTTPAGTAAWARRCAERGTPLVSGTTGLADAEHAALRAAAARVPIVWAPNMSIGVNLLLSLVRQAAARTGADWDIEIVETHHRRKVDAPSGTAEALLQAAAAGRGAPHAPPAGAPDAPVPAAAVVHGRHGLVGPRPVGQIGVHAVRRGEIVGEHQVFLSSAAETLLLEHRAYSRDAFAAGALRAAQWVQGRAPGLYGMGDVLA